MKRFKSEKLTSRLLDDLTWLDFNLIVSLVTLTVTLKRVPVGESSDSNNNWTVKERKEKERKEHVEEEKKWDLFDERVCHLVNEKY